VSFIQIIEFTTSRADELDALLDEWLQKTQGKRTATRGVEARDRDRPNTFVQIIEFPSYEQAMANSELPETAEVAAHLAELCDGPPTFRNLEVAREMQM
jgi:quinol monooxygenase YgiN